MTSSFADVKYVCGLCGKRGEYSTLCSPQPIQQALLEKDAPQPETACDRS